MYIYVHVSLSEQCLRTEISKFELSSVIDEKILGFQVSVENLALMTVCQPSQKLKQEDLRSGYQSEVKTETVNADVGFEPRSFPELTLTL